MKKFFGEINGKHFNDLQSFNESYFGMLKNNESINSMSYSYEEVEDNLSNKENETESIDNAINDLYSISSVNFIYDNSKNWIENVVNEINKMEKDFKSLDFKSELQLENFMSALNDMIETVLEDIKNDKEYDLVLDSKRIRLIAELNEIDDDRNLNNKDFTINNLIINMLNNVKSFHEKNKAKNDGNVKEDCDVLSRQSIEDNANPSSINNFKLYEQLKSLIDESGNEEIKKQIKDFLNIFGIR